jgi:hypothetical protein
MFIIVIAGLLFHPGTRSRWDNNYRLRLADQFLSQLLDQQSLDPQAFWIFRERYSPGYFSLNSRAVKVFQTYRIVETNDAGITELIYYHSPRISSIESVTSQPIELATKAAQIDSAFVLLKTDQLLLTQTNPDEYELWFQLPVVEMMKANGLFDYLPAEMDQLQDKYWWHYSKINL